MSEKPERWLVKTRRYTGSDSVIAKFPDKDHADDMAERYNRDYQADTYYVEQYDEEKLQWPKTSATD